MREQLLQAFEAHLHFHAARGTPGAQHLRRRKEDLSPAEIVANGYSRADVERVVGMVRLGEYKRRQAPIGIRVATRAFGKDCRYPITDRFRHRYDQ